MALAALWACCAPIALAQGQAPVNSIRAISNLSNAQASQRPPADFEATVTYIRAVERTLFVEEDGAAIYVNASPDLKLAPGDRVRVRGTVHPSFRPYVDSREVTLLGHGALPKPEPATFKEMIR